MKKRIKHLLNRLLKIAGLLFILFIALSFTSLPYWAYFALASIEDKLEEFPETIVIMGGDGMPSPSGLMRLHHGVTRARNFPDASIIIALPYNEYDSLHQLKLMAHELVVHGVDTNRIRFEPNGFNTRSQVMEIKKRSADTTAPLLIISSPEHMYRCLATFRKAGFTKVGGSPSFEEPSDEEKLKDKSKSDKVRIKNLALRYNMWSYMQYEIKVLREYAAISYYWIKGWI